MAENDPRPSAYSYIRMSTDIQLRGDSLRRQEHASRRYAEQNDLRLIEDFRLEDIGVSAFKGANVTSGALGRFLDLVKTGTVAKGSYLLVESLDRISRQQVMESVSTFFDIVKSGINVVTLADNHVYRAGSTTFPDLIYAVVVLGRAYEESKTKSVRVGAAWENKRKNLSHRKLTKVAPAWLSLRDDRQSFDVIPDRVQTVREMFRLADAGHGSFTIARHLNISQTLTFTRSNGWHESYVTKILNSRAVLGEFQPHRYGDDGIRVPDGDPVPNYFPAIIDEDQFLRVQASRQKRLVEGAGRKGPEYRNLFTKIAKCGYCGAPMRFVHKGRPPKGTQSLKCTNAVRNLGCQSRGWKYTDFESSFLYFVKEIDLTATLKAAAENSNRSTVEQQIVVHEQKLVQLTSKREKIFALLDEPGPSTAFVRDKLEECEGEIVEQQAQIGELRQQMATNPLPAITAAELQALIVGIQNMSAPDIFERRAAVANRLREIVIHLSLEVAGQKPRQARVAELLADVDPAEREQLLDQVDLSNIEAKRHNRTFTVTLADGTSRRVILDGDDPARFVAEVLIDKGGLVSGSDRGKPISNDWDGWDSVFDEPVPAV